MYVRLGGIRNTKTWSKSNEFDLIYLGFYVAFNTIQVISRRVVGRAEETSTYSSLGLCTVNCRPTASNYQLSHLRPSQGSNPRPQRWEARVLPLCHRGPCKSNERPNIKVRRLFLNICTSIYVISYSISLNMYKILKLMQHTLSMHADDGTSQCSTLILNNSSTFIRSLGMDNI